MAIAQIAMCISLYGFPDRTGVEQKVWKVLDHSTKPFLCTPASEDPAWDFQLALPPLPLGIK